jgi:mono/diheme cytochrome c family protein
VATPATPATPAATAGDAARGRTAFARVCGRCHEDGESDGPAPNRNLEEARMRTIVRQGSGRMRAIPTSRLSDGDLDAVIAYLRTTHAVR